LFGFSGGLLLLIGWINYLSEDGLKLFKLFSKSSSIKSIFKKPKNKGILNMYEDDSFTAKSEKNTREPILSNIVAGIILIIISNFI